MRGGREFYEFTWPGKRASIIEANAPITKTLRPCVEDSKDWQNTKNLYIEGDNLEALKILQESYLGKVKMIYIDPPYNTGNDFIYKDKFSQSKDEYSEFVGQRDEDGNRLFKGVNQKSNPRFHSDWCSMIYSRLLIARNMLSEDGVIFVSIDDNEQDNLKKICNEVYGEKNFVSQLVWEKKKKGSYLDKSITTVKEYILVYAKSVSNFNGIIGEITEAPETYPCVKNTNSRGTRIIRKGITSKYKEKNYSIEKGTRISSGNMELIFLDQALFKDSVLQNDVLVESNWIYSQKALDDYSVKGELYVTRENYIRRVQSEKREKMLKDLLLKEDKEHTSNSRFIYDTNLYKGGWATNEDANEELHSILGVQNIFSFSKPTVLVSKIIQSLYDKNSIVLDFFAGSSTTADSVMQLNSADSGNRQFIMVQLPEICQETSVAFKAGYKNICEIGKERIRRAGEQIKKDHPESKVDVGFRVFKVDSSNMKDVYYNPESLSQDLLLSLESNIKEDRSDLDLLFGCILDLGLTLDKEVKEETIGDTKVYIYNDDEKEGPDLIACFADNITEDVITAIAKRNPLKAVFKDSSFENSPSKINLFELFKTYANISDDKELQDRVRVI